jgi:hypothetical protein
MKLTHKCKGLYRKINTCCYTFVEHETFSEISLRAMFVLYGIRAAISATPHVVAAFSALELQMNGAS